MSVRRDHAAGTRVRIALLALVLALPGAARASWTPAGVPVHADGWNPKSFGILDDHQGGLVIWLRSGGGTTNIFLDATRMDALGNVMPQWDDPTPVNIYAWAGGAADGLGGLYQAWTGMYTDLYLRRIRAEGGVDPAWPVAGTRINGTAGRYIYQTRIIEDGANGVYLLWDELRLRLKRMLPNGTVAPGWPADGLLLGGQGTFLLPGLGLVPDGAGGVYVFWAGDVSPGATGGGMKMQRVTAAGAIAPGWPAEGVMLSDLDGMSDVQVLGAWRHGESLIVSWSFVYGGQQYLYVVGHPGSEGSSWYVECNPAPGTNLYPPARVTSDGSGGVWVNWNGNTGARGWHVRHDGVMLAEDVALLPPGNLGSAWLIPGAAGGAVAFWSDWVDNPDLNLYYPDVLRARWVRADGEPDPTQPSEGRIVGSNHAYLCTASPDGQGGAYVLWNRERTYDYRVSWLPYPQQSVGIDGGGTRDAMRRLFVSPNPARTELIARFTLPSDAPARLELLDLAGRRVRAMDVSGAGEHVERLGGLGGLPAGLYVLRVAQGSDVRIARVALLR